MIFGCCIDLSYYDTLVQNGYQSIALAAKDVAAWDDETYAHNKQILSQGKLETISLNSFCPPELRLDGTGYDAEKLRSYMKRLLPRAHDLGFRMIGIGAPLSRNTLEGDDKENCLEEFAASLRIMCEEAKPYGIDILLESVCSLECNLITTTKEALSLIRKLSLPNLHLVYDIYHECMEHQSPGIIDEAIDEIRVVHIAQDEAGKRAYPDESYLAVCRPYFEKLRDAGYALEWNPECFTGDPSRALPHAIQLFQKL